MCLKNLVHAALANKQQQVYLKWIWGEKENEPQHQRENTLQLTEIVKFRTKKNLQTYILHKAKYGNAKKSPA